MYPVGGAIQRNRLRHVDNGAFRGAVASEVACPYHAEDTRNIDDPTAVSIWVRVLTEHLPRCIFATKENALRVNLLYIVPQVFVGAPDRLQRLEVESNTGIVDEAAARTHQGQAQYLWQSDVHVESAIMGHRRPHQILHLLAASYIRGDEQSIAATIEDHIVRCIITTRIAVTAGCRFCVRAHHVCTFTRESKCNRSTNPRR